MIELPGNNYSIFIGDDGAGISRFVSTRNYSRIAVLVDEHTRVHCLPSFNERTSFPFVVIEIPSGEMHKNLETCRHVWEEMMHHELDRHALVINLGGGVTGDMGGFCAATFLRSIDFIQVPTTLLAQADASVGGKLGIDFNLVKNSIGVFREPAAVFINPDYLRTLPGNEIRSGFAEVFKHALIADAGLWDELKTISDLGKVEWGSLLARSIRIKQQIVEQDPLESGLRKALNFGHTLGHAIESFSMKNKNRLLHGEAVAIGILCESWLSHKTENLDRRALDEITGFILRLYPAYSFGEEDFSQIMQFMKRDKKNRDGKIHFSLIPAIGEVEVNRICEEDQILDSLEYYLDRVKH